MCTLLGGVDICDFSEQISEQSGHAISFSCTGNVAKVGKWCFSKIYSLLYLEKRLYEEAGVGAGKIA